METADKQEIIKIFATSFGMIGEDGEVINIPEIKKELSYEQLYKHFDWISDMMIIELKTAFTAGENSGLQIARQIMRGDDDVKG